MVSFNLKKLFGVPSAAQRLAALNLRPDLAKAVLDLVSDERSDSDLVRLGPEFDEDEAVVIVVEGLRGRDLGFLALTTRRVVFKLHGSQPGHLEVIPLEQISGVADRAKGMNGRVVITGGGGLQVDKVLGIQAAQFAQALRRQIEQPGLEPAVDPMLELQELREQHASGRLSDADYQRAKARLLDEL